MYDLIIRDATMVQAGSRLVADIAVEDGKIAYVGGNAAGGAREEIAGIGRFVMPGVVDCHVHARRAGATNEDEWDQLSRAALVSGITTMIDLPDSTPPTVDAATLGARAEAAAAACLTDFGFWVGATSTNLAELEGLCDAGLAVAPIAYMDRTEGAFALEPGQLEELLAMGGGVLGVHAEDPKLLAKGKRKWSAVEDPVHNDVRPSKAAVEALRQLVALVKKSGRPVHLMSMSTAAELNLLDPIRGDVPISCQVHPYHLFLSVETSGELRDLAKVDPPVRGELDRRALWASIKRGRIDTFGSGHLALTKAQKEVGYWDCPSGIPGIDTFYGLLMSAVKHGRLGLERMVGMCSEAPAELFGLEGKGKIEVGYDADLVLFSEGETVKLRKDQGLTGAGWTPYVGREVGVPPEVVVAGGQVAARAGVLQEGLRLGRRVQRRSPEQAEG